MKSIKIKNYNIYASNLVDINIDDKKRVIINTINAHSYIVAKNDSKFEQALIKSDILLPDGEGIVLMAKKNQNEKIKKIAGADIHDHLLNISEEEHLKCFYIGSSQETLDLMKAKLTKTHPNITFGFFSPPFKASFSGEENKEMISKINTFQPHVVFVGMTAPKQEKWVLDNKDKINANVICSIGAVFDFIAETKKRAPKWIIGLKLEWLYRSFTAWRLTKRYLYSTPLFLIEVYKQKFFSKSN
ncbi:WecB/TagA/CpsF family glycosyltransferase [Psychroserpens jangbogonensis]|uniref:WecB/TagA/CpsF family glycosyltransferase n=1 Tax=Psychroserpens jangbogonensis TaxID=1484460 RepID=UPI000B0C5462|nr:WecB/TagA/CpsF family glycosyltransferase [Psychroserpens jangbogonensis]